MKSSFYNFIWPADDPEKVIVFNSLTTALVEVEKAGADLLNVSGFAYDTLSWDEKQYVNGFRQGGFILDDDADELKILKYAYNSIKYDRMGLGFTIAPTLRCNFACTYCYEQAGENQAARDGRHVLMPENVREELLNYIRKAAKTIKWIHITWYGGEPLLGKEIIFDLSQKMIAIAEENKLDYFAGMVTNGYLLTDDSDIVQKLQDSRIKTFQITIDGPPAVHNSRRMLKGDNGPTFDRVLAGLKLLKANDLDVRLRINVDRSNREEALKLLDILETNNLKDIPLCLGLVTADTAGCKSIESSCSTVEKSSRY